MVGDVHGCGCGWPWSETPEVASRDGRRGR
jgi:hypothetical protein